MFGCCCSSKSQNASIIAGTMVLVGSVGWVLFDQKDRSEPSAQPATSESVEVIPTTYQPEHPKQTEHPKQPEHPKQTEHPKQPEHPENMDPMMAAMLEWGALAPEHEILKGMVGVWDCTTSFNMGGPEPMIGHGTATNTLILGGRYVTQHFVMPDFMGSTYEGMGTFGYDKVKGKFVNIWLDTMSTNMTSMEGTWDEDAQTMTWLGTGISPMGESKMKHLVKIIDDDNTLMEFYEASDMTGGEFVKSGTITYTRQK